MSQSKIRLLELNARLAQNLNDKGVEATADETTTVLVRKVVDIPTAKEEQEKNITITENGTTEILSDENKTLSKVTVNVDVKGDGDSYGIVDGTIAGDLVLESDTIRAYAFYNCPNITSVSLPNATEINEYAFSFSAASFSSQMTKFIAPIVTTIGMAAFRHQFSLNEIYVPNLVMVGNSSFQNTNIIIADLPCVTSLEVNAFYNTPALVAIVLGKRATLANEYAVHKSNIYVKKEDIEWYSTATNWSSLYENGRVKTIEDNLEYLKSLGYMSEVAE